MPAGVPFVTLWCEERQDRSLALRLLAPSGERTINPLPSIPPDLRSIEELVPGLNYLVSQASSRWLLLLEPRLPDAWQYLPWERLSFRGAPLGTQALIVRRAAWSDEQLTKAREGRKKLLNLFPVGEHDFLDELQPLFRKGRIHRCRPAQVRSDFEWADELFIVAHGLDGGLKDAEGRPFSLPVTLRMPGRIWLLACNVGGAMDRLASQLLAQGCRTVISATGNVSAPEMQAAIESWSHQGGGDPARWLAMQPLKADGDCGTLAVWGCVEPDVSDCAPWNRLTWTAAHGGSDELPLGDETASPDFFAAYDQYRSADAWPLTRERMQAPLLWLAENYHHPAIAELERDIGTPQTAPDALALATAARRAGNYPQMARYLSLTLTMKDLPVRDAEDCLGQLANLWIDLDMPQQARRAIDRHADLLIEDVAARQWADRKRLDWLARCMAREGRFAEALDHLAAKQRLATDDGSRELAGQLYLSAWGQIAGQVDCDRAASLARDATTRLETLQAEQIGEGNATMAYLLRALAAYAWAAGDLASLDLIIGWRDEARRRLSAHDPGPWAYLLACLHLGGESASGDEDLRRALAALERSHYHLEAGMFAALAGYSRIADERLQRFKQRRAATLQALGQAPADEVQSALAEAENRTMSEGQGQGSAVSMARRGVLPL
jgi:hypothetical protein